MKTVSLLNQDRRRVRATHRVSGFTLVEMLVVIAIIAMLASLITGAAVMARGAAKRAVIVTEIGQLEMACQAYKEKFGEYPPDGTDVPTVTRHIAKAFPRFTGTPPAYLTAATRLGPMQSLVFWLGGMPDPVTGQPIGFSADPTNPFDATNASRIRPFYDFNPAQLATGRLDVSSTANALNTYRYWPTGVTRHHHRRRIQLLRVHRLLPRENSNYTLDGTSIEAVPTPGVIKSVQDVDAASTTVYPAYNSSASLPQPPTPPTPPTTTVWVNPQSFQIFSSGVDSRYAPLTVVTKGLAFPSGTNIGTNPDGTTSRDNITNFAGGTLESRMP